MKRATVLKTLAAHRDAITAFDVEHLALFGSVARDTATDESDVDFLVSFRGPATLDNYMGLRLLLEDTLKCPVDLVTEKSLRPELRRFVEKDLYDVAEISAKVPAVPQ